MNWTTHAVFESLTCNPQSSSYGNWKARGEVKDLALRYASNALTLFVPICRQGKYCPIYSNIGWMSMGELCIVVYALSL